MRHLKVLLLAILVHLAGSPVRGNEGEWFKATSLFEIRDGHTATLLPSGRLLVAGGTTDKHTYPTSTELYDPADGVWALSGSMTQGRSEHSATLLPSGKVLIAGGRKQEALASAELYDPARGNWILTGPLSATRFDHTATLLPSGKVLVVGGFDHLDKALATAELYDPSTGAWSSAGRLATARGQHTAVLLRSGDVLIVGGRNGDEVLQSAELYDFRAGKWKSGGSLQEGRVCHTATLLASGKVLVVGGSRESNCFNFHLSYPKTVEVYDPASGQWSLTGSLQAGRSLHSAVLLPSGKVIVIGGSVERTISFNQTEVYDPAQGTWRVDAPILSAGSSRNHTTTLLPSGNVLLVGLSGSRDVEIYEVVSGADSKMTDPLSNGRSRHTSTLLPSGKILVAGGKFGAGVGQALASSELYDPILGTWSPTGALVISRAAHTATLLPSGKVLIAGGDELRGPGILASAELYNPETSSWEKTNPLSFPRRGHTATLLPSGKVLVVGGNSGDDEYLASAEVYDPSTGRWDPTGSLTAARTGHTATLLLSGKVLVAGGFDNASLRHAELYDPITGVWTPTGPLLINRYGATATLLPSGKVLVVGGSDGNQPLSRAELYDPAAGTWSPAGELNTERDEHAAVLLPSGRVAIFGGPSNRIGTRFVEVYDPQINDWSRAGSTSTSRSAATATLLPSGHVLLAGGNESESDLASSKLVHPDGDGPASRRPSITSLPREIRFGVPFEITGHFRGDSETTGGHSRHAATNYPLVQLRSLEGSQCVWLVPDSQQSFWDDPMALRISELPPTTNMGWHLLTVFTGSGASASRMISLACSLVITRQPAPVTVVLGGTPTFSVQTQGGRTFQWQKNGIDIPGATGPTYTTPPIAGADSGSAYRVKVSGGCASVLSQAALLTIEDHERPAAAVLSPSGGEYWLLSKENDSPNQPRITWSMSDNVRICRVRVSLLYSTDGGKQYLPAPPGGGLPVTFGLPSPCVSPGTAVTSTVYSVPTLPPSGLTGSLYRIRVQVTDQAGLITRATSPNPFYIVEPNPDSVRTLILANIPRMKERMGISADEQSQLSAKLRELAAHPRVQGLVVDLNLDQDLKALYAAWDADSKAPDKANRVLFGCHDSICTPERKGIHDKVRELLKIYTGVKYLVLVGDDRIIPLARITDRTALLPESRYIEENSLRLGATTVGEALNRNQFLSDDPLAVLAPVDLRDLAGNGELEELLFVPDLAVGRLVENPREIITTISTFISRDGVLDLSQLDAQRGHKILVTGYDFLLDSGRVIRDRWRAALRLSPPFDDNALAPVDGKLLTEDWGVDINARLDVLRTHLCGNGGQPYAVAFLNGHATHDQEGVPGTGPFNIRGLPAAEIYGNLCGPSAPLSFAGGVVFAVGCHGGLPVAGSSPGDRTLDLAQTFLSRGAVAYMANTGYGWGLLHGIGYSERLVQILAEELTFGGVAVTGQAVQRTKLRYFLEAPLFDPYDEKSLLQWTFFGLPMYAIRTGVAGLTRSDIQLPFADLSSAAKKLPPMKRMAGVSVERHQIHTSPESLMQNAVAEVDPGLPPYLTRLDLRFDFSADRVYKKRTAAGAPVELSVSCPDPDGCYYTLNGLVERATGIGDLPIQPYFIYDSRLSGTSQHGVLWKGGIFLEETGWIPVVGELISNNGSGSDHGSTPRHVILKPRPRRRSLRGDDPDACRLSDLEVSSLVVPAGEALKASRTDPTYSIQRRYHNINLEAFYFNNTENGQDNCDRTGPELLPGRNLGAYHTAQGGNLLWEVPVSLSSDAWRVVVVYTNGKRDDKGYFQWLPIDLREDAPGIWKGQISLQGVQRITYVIQAVDRRGNVTWLDDTAVLIRTSPLRSR